MSRNLMQKQGLLFLLMAFLLLSTVMPVHAESSNPKGNVYDYANLLTEKEVADLQALSNKLGKERNTSFIIITTNGTQGKDIVQYVEDFYDQQAPGYDKPHGNTAIIAIDMENRDIYLAGFKKAEKYLDDKRLNLIRDKMTPDLSNGNYYQAFSTFMTKAYDYMGYEPGVNPENILFKWWFQLVMALIVAGVVVGIMAYRSGGRVTVNARTYMDRSRSRVVDHHDNYVRQTVTRVPIPKNDTKNGGGGGMTGGGFSHSGSQGKF